MFDKDDQEISQIIEIGLEAILSGKVTLEQFLAEYPEQAAAVRPELEAAIWLVAHRDEVRPRPGFIRSSRKRVVARIKEEASQSGAKRSIFGFVWPQKLAYQWAAALMVIILFFSGTGGVVSASQSALPGENLYSIKLASEEIAFTLTFNDVKRVELSAAFTERRLNEVLALMERGDQQNMDKALEAFERQVGKTIALLQAVQGISQAEKKELAVTIYQDFAEQAGRLSSLHAAVNNEVLRDQIETVERLMVLGASEAADEANKIFDPTSTPIVIFTLTPSVTNTTEPSSTPAPEILPLPSSTPSPTMVIIPPTNTGTSTPEPSATEQERDFESTLDGKPFTKTPKPTNINRPEKPDTGKPEVEPPKPAKPEQPEKPENPENSGKPENPGNSENSDKPEKPEKPEKEDKD